MTLLVLVLVAIALIGGYTAGRLDRAETDDVANRVLDALERIYEQRNRQGRPE